MGWLAASSGILFLAAMALLATFFSTGDERFDRAAEVCFVLFALVGIPTIAVVGGRLPDGVVGQVVTAVGIGGVGLLGLGELGSVLRVVDFRKLAPLVAAAFFAFLAWIGAVSAITVANGGLPTNLGWLGIVTIAAGALIVGSIVRQPGVITGEREPPIATMRAMLVPMVGIAVWMTWLGYSL